ncbi:WD40-repeat-containing domain protein [Scheffersomyces coipomensis]|uniref:WD40-repeat-containing domain protein n=1 Tax=Scheffersomyces coipomensis TaxID=1788519 RepID=UPI00315D627E
MAYTSKELAKAEVEILEDHRIHEKIVNEEFKIWKKTVPLLYDTIHSIALDSPSLVFKWLPSYTYSNNKDTITAKFLIGTNVVENSNTNNSNYLKIGSINLPSSLAPDFSKPISKPSTSNSDFSTSNFIFNIGWKQSSEIDKLSLSPDASKILSFNSDGIVRSYNLDNDDVIDYKYHKQEGFALEWITNEEFISGSNDSQIALWNINKPSTPIQLFKDHFGAVNDLSVNSKIPQIFGSVSDDYTTQIHDSRVSITSEDSTVVKIQNKYIQNSIKFHPSLETVYITAGKDNVISLYDLRNPTLPFRKFFGHNDSIIGLNWNIDDSTTFTSWSLDKRVITWDLKNLEEEFIYPTSENGNEGSKKRSSNNNNNKVDPCLKFIHAGHTNRINDIGLHPTIKNLYGSVGDDNLLEIWQPKTLPVEEEEEEEEDEEEEEEAEEEEEQKEAEVEEAATEASTASTVPTTTAADEATVATSAGSETVDESKEAEAEAEAEPEATKPEAEEDIEMKED